MKNRFFTLLVLMMAVLGLKAQIFSDDFESYTVGQPLAQQAGNPWTTWSNQPGGAEDPLISNAQAEQGSKSFVVTGTNDCVLLLGDSTSGRYKLDFYIYVPSGKLGFYDLLATFAGSNSKWGLQVYFDLNGNGTIDAGVPASATFTYNNDQWIHMENYIDLDNDWAELYIDGQYIYDWQWTAGATGTTIPDRLAAADFYAWTGSKAGRGTPQAYYDNIAFQTSPLPAPPQNLTATLNDTIVSVQWDAPASGTPDSYYVYRNGYKHAVVSTTSYSDTLSYPGTYSYDVKAYYADAGLSAFAGSDSVLLAGGINRNLVLVEIGTGTGCPYCPGAAMGADDMIANGDPVAVIEYHSYNSSDPFNNTESAARTGYYGITGYPTAEFDGGNAIVGGSNTQSLFSSYHPVVISRAAVPSIFNTTLSAQMTGGTDTTFDVNINVTKTYNYAGTNVRLFLALTESHIPFNWEGQSEINNTCRAMYPDANGTSGDFQLNVPQNFQFTIDIPNDYIIANCNLIAFVQDVDTKEVMQTQMVNLGQIVGISEPKATYSKIYPNPASGTVNIQTASNIKHLRIFDLNGRMVYNVAADSKNVHLDVSSFTKGIYMLSIDTENGNLVKKLSVR